MQIVFVFAQSGTGISGKVMDAKTQKPLSNAVVSIQNTSITKLTNAEGKFVIDNATAGNQLLQVKSNTFKEQLIEIQVVAGQILDLGLIMMEEAEESDEKSNVISITETDVEDENNAAVSTASLLEASKDAFLQAAGYNFGDARFSVRGIDNEYSNTMINGVVMNRIYDGRPQFSNWGGLNDATRNQEFTNGSAPSDYTFGGILGTQEISTRASNYKPGSRVSFLGTNTNYNWRFMATTASGMSKDGWAYTLSAGRRWAVEGNFEGTDYLANSFFASVEKKINDNQSLNLTVMNAQNRRGKNSPNTQEVTDLKGIKYNSYWGWQDGKKRNSRVKEVEEPLFMLTHYWKMDKKNNLTSTVSYQFGKIGDSRLDYYQAPNPDPTYYHNLPSYETSYHDAAGNYMPDFAAAAVLKTNFLADGQINWNKMYYANRALSGNSHYALYEDRRDEKLFSANSIYSSSLSDNIVLNAGVTYSKAKSENFRNMLDLLGGQYFIDKDPFVGGLPNSEDPDRQVVKGDKYRYDYFIHSNVLTAFTQFKFTYKKIDFYLAQSFSKSNYQREGLYKNDYYANNSKGKSEEVDFDNFGFKGGITYKISGRNYLDFNGVYMSKAPNTKEVFENARLNNNITKGIASETIRSADVSYIIRAPKFKSRLTGYYSETANSSEISFFYTNAGNNPDLFLSEIVTGLGKKNRGIELGLEYQITPTFKATGVAAYGEYTFNKNPLVYTTSESVNGFSLIDTQISANLSGYKQAGMPQQAYSIGLEYRDPKFWWIGTNANYLAENYLDVSTLLRTNLFYTLSDLPIDQGLADQYLQQEKFNNFFLFNIVGGKSWKIGKETFGFLANVNNILNTNFKTGGFEQARKSAYSDIFRDNEGGTRAFGPKYFYGYGRTFSINLYINF